jgi:serine/threonine protein kinase
MVEKRELPKAIVKFEIKAKIEAKIKEILGERIRQTDERFISKAWNRLPPGEQEALRREAESMLFDEEKFQYGYRIIDLGLAANEGEIQNGGSLNTAPEMVMDGKLLLATSSYDMYTLGTILSTLFFGRAGMYSGKLGVSAMQCQKGNYGLYCSSFMRYVRSHQESEVSGYILGEFQRLNAVMEELTEKSYPEPVLKRLAAMTADCLAMDPTQRPTAEHVLLALQNLGFSDWGSGQYNIQDVPELTPEQGNIQGQFWWVNGNKPPPEADAPQLPSASATATTD